MNRTLAPAAAVLAALVLAGCSESTPSTTASSTTPSPAKSTDDAKTSASPSPSAGDPVGYLYDVDHHRHAHTAVATLVGKLRARCSDNTLGLEFTATNTALDLVDAEHPHQDVYPVLAQLVAGLPSGKTGCASRLPAVEKQLKAKRAATEKPTPTATPTHRAVQPKATHAPAPATHTSAPAVNDHNGATALCNDGTLSYSAHHRGTCSHHHGVAVWYK